jgi:hypothetical protein
MVLPIKDSDPLLIREAEEPDNINLRGYFLSKYFFISNCHPCQK